MNASSLLMPYPRAWIREWMALYERGEPGLLRLDTRRIEAMPAALV